MCLLGCPSYLECAMGDKKEDVSGSATSDNKQRWIRLQTEEEILCPAITLNLGSEINECGTRLSMHL